MKWISYLQIRKHVCTLLFLTREFARKRYSVNERVKRKLHFSDDSSEHLWLVIAFISSTASCVIGYNAQCFTNVSVSGSVPVSKCRFEFSSWWYDTLNDLITLVWLYKILFAYFLCFGSCIQNPLGSKFRDVPPHFEWAWRLCPYYLSGPWTW